MGRIPEEIVDRVRTDASIVDVIGDYVRLRRSGKNWTGLCPFHDDTKPSFHVEPVKGIFKCFACGEGGNVFTFLMKLNSWTFPETVRHLARQVGVEIPETPGRRKDLEAQERLVQAVTDAGRLYHDELRSSEGKRGLQYLRKRGLSDDTIDEFGLGFAPDQWEWLKSRLLDSGYTPEELVKSGLVIHNESKDRYYDRFRHRTLFPIFEPTGRLVGFGARRMSDDDDQPKYINSPDSTVYNKSRVLYGLFQGKDAIRKEGYALVVEGYLDVLSLHQSGVKTAVAPCGTAMAEGHARLLSRYAERAVLVFDSDEAGEKATERGIDVLIRGGIDVSVVRLPDGEDPDTFVQSQGAGALNELIRGAVSFVEFKARVHKKRGDFDSPERQAKAIRSIVSTIALIPDKLKREIFINRIAADFGLTEQLLWKELEQAVGKSRSGYDPVASKSTSKPVLRKDPDRGAAVQADDNEANVGQTPYPPAEFTLLKVLVRGEPDLFEETMQWIAPEDLSHPLLREFLELVIEWYGEGRGHSIDRVPLETLPDRLRQLVTDLAIEGESLSDRWNIIDPDFIEPNPRRIARDCMVRIEQQKLALEYREIQNRIGSEEVSESDLDLLFARLTDLNKKRIELSELLGGG